MRILPIIAFLAAAAVPAWAQEEARKQEDPRVKEKLEQIWEKLLELKGLKAEFQSIYSDLYGWGPQYFSLAARGLYTWWDEELDLEDAPGFGADAMLGYRVPPDMNEGLLGFSIMPFGVRYWRAADQDSDEDVSILSYRILGISGEYLSSTGYMGCRMTVVGGLTRFASEIPGVESDTAPTLSSEMDVYFTRGRSIVYGFGGAWEMVRTRFRFDHTETVHNFSATLTLGFSF